MSNKLQPGDMFPGITLNTVDGREINLPADLNSPFTVVLFYRGHW
jgi:peroxiredoxin